MLDGIVERFPEREEELMARLGGDRAMGQDGRQFHARANRSVFEKIVGRLREIFNEPFEGIVLRVDGPDDFVQGLGDFAGG
jgi:hypothetical protein